MKETTIKVKNQIGLHALPATFFIQAANTFESSVWLEKEEKRSNAKSLLGVLALGIVGGSQIKIIASGPDEDIAVKTLEKFINSGFENEDELNRWIEELSDSVPEE